MNNLMKIDGLKHSQRCLVVIMNDRLSTLSKKGELTECYYNPGEIFSEVHIILTNDDEPILEEVQKTVGCAKLIIHNLPKPNFFLTLGWQFLFMKSWVRKGLEIIDSVKPELVRTHCNFWDGYLASEIRRQMGIPFVTSLHGVWDRDCLDTLPRRIRRKFLLKFEERTLTSCSALIAVYKPIIRYALEHNAKNIKLIYNIVAGKYIKKKLKYKISGPVKIITVNRQIVGKNPENIIRALKDIDCEYWLVGNGELNAALKSLVRDLGMDKKVKFLERVDNAELCAMLHSFDIMVSQCDYLGIAKSNIEGALAGLPMILNKPTNLDSDFNDDWILLCENSEKGYFDALNSLIKNQSLRELYGRAANKHASMNFDPSLMEQSTVSLYLDVLSGE